MSLEIFDSIVPAGEFPVALAKYIKTDDGKSLEDALNEVNGGGVSSWNDLADKPFGEETATIFEGQFQDELEDSDGDGVNDVWLNQMVIIDESDAAIEAGKTYAVTWEEEEYVCECKIFDGLPVVGNTIVFGGEDNGFPFLIARDKTGAAGMGKIWIGVAVTPQDITESGLYPFKIVGEKINEIDRKYLPAIPIFDLGALGLTAIPITGEGGVLETDTTDIVAAFEKGPVAFVIPVDVGGQTANATIVMNPASAMGSYQSIALINFTELATVTINVGEGMLRVSIVPLVLEQEEEGAVSSTVDLTDFETDGIITETFASGEENIYTFEFDADGKPTRITDSKGNETALTW